jgi:hypothetical protein
MEKHIWPPLMQFMNPAFKPIRWLIIIPLGIVLGLVYVFVNLSLLTLPDDNRSIYVGGRQSHRFQISEDSRARELTQVIESQLSAFRNNDYSKAYTYAASALTSQMSLSAFERMVKTGYPLMMRSRSTAFGVIFDNGEQAVVNVGIMGGSGRIHHFKYFLERENAGWRIRGVTEVKFAGTTV